MRASANPRRERLHLALHLVRHLLQSAPWHFPFHRLQVDDFKHHQSAFLSAAVVARLGHGPRYDQKILERQRDAKTREAKCVVAGITLDGTAAEAVVNGLGGKLIIITVYVS